MGITAQQIHETMGMTTHVKEKGKDGKLVTEHGILTDMMLDGSKKPVVIFTEVGDGVFPSKQYYIPVDLKHHYLHPEEGYAVLTVQAGNCEVLPHNP